MCLIKVLTLVVCFGNVIGIRILKGQNVHRPSVVFNGYSYQMVTQNTSSELDNGWLPLFASATMGSRWNPYEFVFDERNFPLWADKKFFGSPAVTYDSRYYNYFLFFHGKDVNGNYRIGAAKSESIFNGIVANDEFFELDTPNEQWYPGIIHELSAKEHYLTWASGSSGIYAKSINPENLTLSDEQSTLLLTPSLPWELGHIISASHVARKKYNYLIFANGGGCNSDYQDKAAIGVARSIDPLGPYEKLEYPLINSTVTQLWGTESANIVIDKNSPDNYMIVYDGISIGTDGCTSPEIHLRQIEWLDDWPYIVPE